MSWAKSQYFTRTNSKISIKKIEMVIERFLNLTFGRLNKKETKTKADRYTCSGSGHSLGFSRASTKESKRLFLVPERSLEVL